MSDNINLIEEEDVIIKQEHAYASKEDNAPNDVSLDDDPLKIMPSDVETIKVENDYDNVEHVEIKVESDLGHNDGSRKEIDTTLEYNEDLSRMDVENMGEFASPVSVLTMNFSGDFVPKSAFVNLQNKYVVIFFHHFMHKFFLNTKHQLVKVI